MSEVFPVKISLNECEDLALAVEQDGSRVDPHKANAARIFGVSYEEVTAEQRQQGKKALYSLIYGGNMR